MSTADNETVHRTDEPHQCKKCFYAWDSHSNTDDNKNPPQENDLTICFYCGTISKFDKDLNLIELTESELLELKQEYPKEWEALKAYATDIKQKIKQN